LAVALGRRGCPCVLGKAILADVTVKEAVLVLFSVVTIADREVFPHHGHRISEQAGFWQHKRDRTSILGLLKRLYGSSEHRVGRL
jgi:hypothetical protein